MAVLEHPLAGHLVRHLPLQLHHHLEHLVVCLAGEKDFARVELIDGASHRPHVKTIVILVANDW